MKVSLPPQIQHLLGVLQIVDHNLAVVRGQLLAPEVKIYLQQLAFQLIELEETKSVRQNQAMNFVTVSPRRIVMVAGNPETKLLYENHGIDVAAEVDVSELLKGAGGIGCATGILSRKPV
jgi:N-dimethylarginine dimethylaminohydrolase